MKTLSTVMAILTSFSGLIFLVIYGYRGNKLDLIDAFLVAGVTILIAYPSIVFWKEYFDDFFGAKKGS